MTNEKLERLMRIVCEAESLQDDARDAFLAQACADDEVLKNEALRLLRASSTKMDLVESLAYSHVPDEIRFERGESVGPYRIEQRLARGGMGVVYRAHDPRTSRPVAIKFLPQKVVDASADEAKILGGFKHPNIVPLFDVGKAKGVSYFVMEYVEGDSIADYCTKNRVGLDRRLSLILSLCDAVQYAHQRFVVHRDLKPSNILVTHDGVPKLLDFGIAKVLPPDPKEASVTDGLRPLTTMFASPEHLDGGPTTAATDVYGLGLVATILLTGRYPYRVDSEHDVAWAVRHIEPVPPSRLLSSPRELNPFGNICDPSQEADLEKRICGDIDAILLKALRKEPESRYGSVAALAADLRRHQSQEPVRAVKGNRFYRVRKYVARNMLAIGAALVVGVSLATAASWSYFKTQEVTVERDRTRVQLARATSLVDFLVRIFEVPDPWKEAELEVTAREVLDSAAADLESPSMADSALLLQALSQTYLNLGVPERALEISQKAVSFEGRVALEDEVGLFATHASALAASGHLSEATVAAESALAALEMLGDVDAASQARGLVLIAGTFQDAGEYTLAESWYDRVVSLLDKRERDFPEIFLEALMGRGEARLALGDYEDSLNDLQQTLETSTAIFGSAYPKLAEAQRALGSYYRAVGELDKAEEALVHAAGTAEKILGSQHPRVAIFHQHLGQVLIDQGRYEDAESTFRHAVSILESVYGEGHRAAGPLYLEVANALQGLGEERRAEPLMRDALESLRRTFPENHPWTALALNNLGLMLMNKGELEEAQEALRESLAIRAIVFGIESLEVASVRGNLATLHYELGDLEAAIEWNERATEAVRAALGADHHYVAIGLNNGGFFLRESGRIEEAIASFRSALRIYDAEEGAPHPYSANTQINLASTLLIAGKPHEVPELLKAARETLAGSVAETHHDVFVEQGVRGQYHHLVGEHEAASELLLSSYVGLNENAGPKSDRTQAALERLVAFYRARGDLAEEARFRALLDSPPE